MTTTQTAYKVDAEHFRRRVLQDLLTEGLACYWERRAEVLLAAASRPGDYIGAATPAEVVNRDQRLRDDADRCLRHAAVLRTGPDLHSEDVRNVLAEVTG